MLTGVPVAAAGFGVWRGSRAGLGVGVGAGLGTVLVSFESEHTTIGRFGELGTTGVLLLLLPLAIGGASVWAVATGAGGSWSSVEEPMALVGVPWYAVRPAPWPRPARRGRWPRPRCSGIRTRSAATRTATSTAPTGPARCRRNGVSAVDPLGIAPTPVVRGAAAAAPSSAAGLTSISPKVREGRRALASGV